MRNLRRCGALGGMVAMAVLTGGCGGGVSIAVSVGIAGQVTLGPINPAPVAPAQLAGPVAAPLPSAPAKASSWEIRGDTVFDRATGLTWQRNPDFTRRDFHQAGTYAASLDLAGHTDWRLPTIQELASIADFAGNEHQSKPYLDADVFGFRYPEEKDGVRRIDGQFWSSHRYQGRTMAGDLSAFGFNFADGRIKSYPLEKGNWVRAVRGPARAASQLVDNGDGTLTDRATGLQWMKDDAGRTMDWETARAWAADLKHAGHDDWRVPDARELLSIVDYTRAPDAEDPDRRGPALDPRFGLSDPGAWCWTSTEHVETGGAYYVAFGRATSVQTWNGRPMDAHGAGALRSDPKAGDPARWANGLGPQLDEIRIRNHVRAVRGTYRPSAPTNP